MNKLIELFNKHIEENTGQKYYLNERDVKDKLDSLLILRYFIKWLVDNDKIDLEEFTRKKSELFEALYITNNPDKNRYYYESLLMLLAISQNPISDLISYLK